MVTLILTASCDRKTDKQGDISKDNTESEISLKLL